MLSTPGDLADDGAPAIRRRTMIQGAAWAAPVVLYAVAAPARAASVTTPTVVVQTDSPAGVCSGTSGGDPITLLRNNQTSTWTFTVTVAGGTIGSGGLAVDCFIGNPGADSASFEPWSETSLTSTSPAFTVGTPFGITAGGQPVATTSGSSSMTYYPITQVASLAPGTYAFTATVTVGPEVNEALSGGHVYLSVATSDPNSTVAVTNNLPLNSFAPYKALNGSTGQPWCS